MAYTNSPLVDCTIKSPNHSGTRTHKIDRITPHCFVGQVSAERIGKSFTEVNKSASCNYGIASDGRVCLVVDEKNRSWCTSSNENDQRAITIECASDNTHPYAFKSACYDKLIKLCIDICKRNNLNKVLWFNDKEKSLNYEPQAGECVLTVHRWYANKSCPGDWMYSHMGQLADEINKGLSNTTIPENKSVANTTLLQQGSSGEKVKTLQANLSKLEYNCGTIDGIFGTKTYTAVKKFQTDKKLTVDGIVGEKTQSAITTALKAISSTSAVKEEYKVRVTTAALHYRNGPGTNYQSNGVIRDQGTYTIIDESTGTGAKLWGKLKSGAGWISLDYTKKI